MENFSYTTLLDTVKRLEGKNNGLRRHEIKSMLADASVDFAVQRFAYGFRTGENIIVDIGICPPGAKRIVLSAHYDVWGGSPGANDNGSGIAVLLELIRCFVCEGFGGKAVRFVFFDHEDFLLGWHTGAWHYIETYGLDDIDVLYNLEMVGIGDSLLLWPIEERQLQLDFLTRLTDAIDKAGLRFARTSNMPFFSSDHRFFLKRGFKRACTITSFSYKDTALRKRIEKEWFRFGLSVVWWWVTRRGEIPDALKHYHNALDRSEFLSESMMQKTAEALSRLIRGK